MADRSIGCLLYFWGSLRCQNVHPWSLRGTFSNILYGLKDQFALQASLSQKGSALFENEPADMISILCLGLQVILMFFSLTNSEKLLEVNSPLYAPFQQDDALVFSSFNGEIIKYVEGQLKLFAKVNGQIRGMVYDQAKNCYYLADLLRQSVISLSATDASETELVNEYEGAPLLGPHSLTLSNLTGNVFFTDCGAFGENSPSNAQGSLFVIDMQQQSIRSLALRCLSAPTGLAFGKDQKLLYVCETGRNRILRFYQSKEGIYYVSVFHQFSGRFGPTSIAVTAGGVIITALFEFRGLTEEGSLGFLNEEGEMLQKLKLPQCGPEISGLFLSRQTEEDVNVLVTENSGRQSCHKLIIKVDKGK